MRKAAKLSLRRLTLGQISSVAGGASRAACYRSYDNYCSNSCNTCGNNAGCWTGEYSCIAGYTGCNGTSGDLL